MPYHMFVDDNFHYMDRSYRSGPVMFLRVDEALAAARQIVDRFLAENHVPGMAADTLYGQYTMFVEDPFIVALDGPEVQFSAWSYAKEQSCAVCGG
jgi:hypothetical protein